jgi:SNF family Na+-dependent transporter
MLQHIPFTMASARLAMVENFWRFCFTSLSNGGSIFCISFFQFGFQFPSSSSLLTIREIIDEVQWNFESRARCLQ